MSLRSRDMDLRLPSEARSATAARRALVEHLLAAGLDRAVVDDAALVVTELVANAVLHGRPDRRGCIDVQFTVADDVVRLQVHDSGGGAGLRVQPAGPHETRGRGLAIVDTLCRFWRIDRDHGTTVVAELACA